MRRTICRIGRSAILAGIAADFRTALEPYGSWRRHSRFGDIWVPGNVSRDWRPYIAGHWVYTDDYGWYWISDAQESDWGWVAYHYGRWYLDPNDGWIWIPRDEWGPAWVDWRRGDQYVGWAPLPPDDVVVEDDPQFWSFVQTGDLIAPSIAAVLLPPARRAYCFERTVTVNRPVTMRDNGARFSVNPGVPPAYIAAAHGKPFRSYAVRPVVLAGTANLRGATRVSTEDLRRRNEAGNRPGGRGTRFAARETVRSSNTVIRPAGSVPSPQRLGRGEPGRLGEAPPRAARNAVVERSGAPRETRDATTPPRGTQRQTSSPEIRGERQRN